MIFSFGFSTAFFSTLVPATLGGVIAIGGEIGWFLGGGATTVFFCSFLAPGLKISFGALLAGPLRLPPLNLLNPVLGPQSALDKPSQSKNYFHTTSA